MPQLDPSSFASQLFWLAITFSFIYLVVSRFALPEIGKVLRKRQDRIQNDIEQAEKLKDEAGKLKEEYEASIETARIEAHEVITQSQSEAEEDARRRHAELDDVLAEKLVEAEAKIKTAEQTAIETFTPVAAELSNIIVNKLINIEVDETKTKAIVSETNEKG